MANFVVPDDNATLNMLGLVFGDDLRVAHSTPLTTQPSDRNLVAIYRDDDGEPAAACLVSLSFAVYSGAALSRIPPNAAEEAIRDSELTGMMFDNLREVMNLCSSLLMNDNTPHLKLSEVYKPGDHPQDHVSSIKEAAEQTDFEISIPKYGDGTLSFFVT